MARVVCPRCGDKYGFLASPREEFIDSLGICISCLKARIEEGDIPTIRASVMLATDELCYLDMPTTYHEVRGKRRLPVAGKLIVTSKKILFVGPKGGSEVALNKVLDVTWGRAGIHLHLARQSGSGDYDVRDAAVVGLIISAAVRIANRHLLSGAGRDTRSIPQHVKAAVYQRDGGRCAQCGAQSYLEFDHVIPLSKGGATSVNNLQLLCRRCNAEKSDSI